MLKKVLAGLFIVIIIAAGIYGFFYLKKIKTPVSNAINAIPVNASVIFQSKTPQLLWRRLSETNVMWQDLMGTDFFSQLNKRAKYIDSLANNNEAIRKLMNNHDLFISAHLGGADSFDFLYTYSLPDITRQADISAFIKKNTAQYTTSQRKYDGAVIYTIHLNDKQTFNYAFSKGVFMASFREFLVENAIRQLDASVSLLTDSRFKKVLKTAGSNVLANVYINYKTLNTSLKPFLNSNSRFFLKSLPDFASWTEVDLALKPSELVFNGFTISKDSANSYLGLFSGQKPQNIELTKVLPDNTSSMLFFGYSDFQAFYNNYKQYLDNRHELFDYKKYVNKLNDKYHIAIDTSFLSWINNEAALVVTEPASSNIDNNFYAIFHSNNIENAKKLLKALGDTIQYTDQLHNKAEAYRGYDIRYIALDNVLPHLLGAFFGKIKHNYYTAIGDYIIFGNTAEAIRSYINKYVNGQTLGNDKYYSTFSADHLNKQANMYIYSNIARSTNVYSNYTKYKYTKDIKDHLDIYRKFQAVGIQFSSSINLFYTNVYLKRNPVYKQETGSLWQAKLDTSVSSKPWFVTDFYTKGKEVFVQDDANKIYLISNTGKILWKKQLPEKIISHVYQIDRYKNGKLQMLFNTKSKIYLIDRDGNNVENYPVKLKSMATNGLSLFDYDKNRNYRILIACADKHIFNYDGTGKIVKGWDFKKTKDFVSAPIKHCSIKGKDYIIIVDQAGKVYIVDRQGDQRIKIKKGFNTQVKHFYLDVGKDLASSNIVAKDTLGNVITISLTGNKESIKLDDFSDDPYFDYKDLNMDQKREYIFLDKNELNVYDQGRSLVFNYEFKDSIHQPPMYFLFPDGKGRVGIVSKSNNQLLLLNKDGKLCQGFPLYGSTPFSIANMNNDNSIYLVAGSKDHFIYTYLLPEGD